MNCNEKNTLIDSSYQSVSTEYYNEGLHPTCHNFNQLSRVYITSKFQDAASEFYVLEVGAGDSTAAQVMHLQGCTLQALEISDASEKMLVHSRKWEKYGAKLTVADAQNLPMADSSVSLMISGLGDPYNTPRFWREVHRVLMPGGKIIFTEPSFDWAAKFRKLDPEAPPNFAQFKLADKRTVNVPSFIGPLDAQVELIEKSGLVVNNFETLGQKELGADQISPKIKVLGNNISSIVWGFTATKDCDDALQIPASFRAQLKELLLNDC